MSQFKCSSCQWIQLAVKASRFLYPVRIHGNINIPSRVSQLGQNILRYCLVFHSTTWRGDREENQCLYRKNSDPEVPQSQGTI